MTTRKRGGDESPPASADLPPVAEWITNHMNSLDIKNNEKFFDEMGIIAQIISGLRKHRAINVKDRTLRKDLSKVRDAAKILEKYLPTLIAKAEEELSYKPLVELPSYAAAGHTMARQALETEYLLLILAKRLRSGRGFYGAVPYARQTEPWTGHATLIFELFRISFKESGLPFPLGRSLSERSPITKVVGSALMWLGYGTILPSRIAQAIKRGFLKDEKKQSRLSPEQVAFRSCVERVLSRS